MTCGGDETVWQYRQLNGGQRCGEGRLRWLGSHSREREIDAPGPKSRALPQPQKELTDEAGDEEMEES